MKRSMTSLLTADAGERSIKPHGAGTWSRKWPIVFILFLLTASTVAASPGSGALDPTFSNDGVHVFGEAGSFQAVAIQPDGKILLGGTDYDTTLVVRMTATGELDKTFGGGDGRATVDFAMQSEFIRELVVLPGGNILATGYASNTGDPGEGIVVLIRFDSSGEPDPQFGNGGIVTDEFGQDPGAPSEDLLDFADSMSVSPNGNIALVGDSRSDSNRYMFIAAYSDDGTRTGLRLIPDTTGEAVAHHTSGDIIAGGGRLDGGFLVARVDAEGPELDLNQDFGNGGTKETTFSKSTGDDVVNELLIDGQGRIIAAGTLEEASGGAVTRYLPGGSLDQTFSGDGKLVVEESIAVHLDGLAHQIGRRILLGGSSRTLCPTRGIRVTGGGPCYRSDMALVRLTSKGVFDKSFSGDGFSIVRFAKEESSLSEIAVQPDGKTVLAGSSTAGSVQLLAGRVRGDIYPKVRGKASGQQVQVSGSLFPALPGETVSVRLYRRTPGGNFKKVGDKDAVLGPASDGNSDGWFESPYSATFPRPNTDRCQVKARFEGSTGYQASPIVKKSFNC